MINRCIMIFPDFSNMHIIDEIRHKYDPLCEQVRPHITLVFPFASNLEYCLLHKHLQRVLAGFRAFPLTMRGITAVQSFGNYLFLNLEEGREMVVELHNRLYTGILAEHKPKWLEAANYRPHMTVGRIEFSELYQAASREVQSMQDVFQTTISKVSVEIIGEKEESIIEMEIGLK